MSRLLLSVAMLGLDESSEASLRYEKGMRYRLGNASRVAVRFGLVPSPGQRRCANAVPPLTHLRFLCFPLGCTATVSNTPYLALEVEEWVGVFQTLTRTEEFEVCQEGLIRFLQPTKMSLARAACLQRGVLRAHGRFRRAAG